jgi:stage II sporulation protein P
MVNKKNLYIIILIIVFLSLNAGKFLDQGYQVVPVWTNYEEDYYHSPTDTEERGIFRKINNLKTFLSPPNLIYYLTGIKPRIPMTYLKREIPFLEFYNPGALEEAENIIYTADNKQDTELDISDSNNRVIELQFNLSKPEADGKDNLANNQQNNKNTMGPSKKQEKINKDKKKLVAIYHTHTSETYMDDSRPQDNNGHVMPGEIGNVARAGRELARILSKRYNFEVIHITRVHDKSYARSYFNSRQTVKNILSKNQEIDMLIDIHRDGIREATRQDVITRINGERAAKIMIVVTNGSFNFAHLDLDDQHLDWEKNLDFAKKLAAKMKSMYPSLLKRVETKDTIYNQDLHPQSILLEIGDYRNTTREALNSARLLADVIAAQLLSN